ncbi:hypothetical protein FV139_18530 [Parahaliea maris]|uniref:Cytochrome c domain-containing protein n=1 Tax=Parahaliea maris TaxID=2716870 RepID=A0A5C8ZPU5_9GAMM|nr:hypothetical protein FV139_18530 [Parahaliea maris]
MPLVATSGTSDLQYPQSEWWAPGDKRTFPAYSEHANEHGRIGIINASGAIETDGHPFFTPMGSNGRACVTCHQPGDGMSVSVTTIQRRWEETGGKDPLFAAIDGSNCPSLPQGDKASHSLLLERGLFRLGLPWPPKPYDGEEVEPEFSIEVVSDPSGCNLDPEWGLRSDSPTVSVFRRPRPVINISHLVELPHGVPPHDKFYYNDKTLLPTDPETGDFVSLQLMTDGRGISPKEQAKDAARTHLQRPDALPEQALAKIEAFEKQLYAGQVFDNVGGVLTGAGAPPGIGPNALLQAPPGRLGNNPINRVFGEFSMWEGESGETGQQTAFRNSVARGARVFFDRRFYISNVGSYNDKGLGNPFKRSCGGGCHNTTVMGMDLAPGFMDLGLNSWPWQNQRDDLPLFRITCKADVPPQSYLGREILTHDPGRALITGKCRDVGATMTQQMRALAGRAPYFTNGSAANLRELVDFYDRRFNIGYSEQEKQDLVNFMRTL